MQFPRFFAGAGVVAAAAATLPAATLILNDPLGDPASVTNVAPGSTFQLWTSLRLEPGDEAVSLSFLLSASQSGIFSIVDRTEESASEFIVPITANPAAASSSPDLSPVNGRDLGSYTEDEQSRPAGTYQLFTYTLQVAADAPTGTYQIQAAESSWGDAAFDTYSLDSTTYSVSVAVPEPMIVSAAAIVSSSLLFRRRAQHKIA